MNTEAIEFICQKLGTTVDNIIPAALEFGIYENKIMLIIGIILLAIGIICTAIIIYLVRKPDYYDYPIATTAIGFTAGVVGIIFIIASSISLHLFYKFPEMQAYKMILGWIKG